MSSIENEYFSAKKYMYILENIESIYTCMFLCTIIISTKYG